MTGAPGGGTTSWPAVAVVLGSAAAGLLAALLVREGPGRLVRPNYAGRPVPAVLGSALVGGVVAAFLGVGVLGARYELAGWDVAAVLATAFLAGAGFLDDLEPGGPRGFRGHLAGLVRGRVTTGVVKLVAGVVAAVTVAGLAGGGPVHVVAAALLIAACTNVWNALDVVPGRALKWGAIALLPILVRAWEAPFALLAAGALGAAVGVLPWDLLERGMLGDQGSNPLGFVVGVGLAVVLPTSGLVAAAAGALALQVAAETVTISRLIEAVPPLRWVDRLGRRRPAQGG